MVLSFVYLVFVSLLKLLLRSGRRVDARDIELLLLRHQPDVLRRQVERPQLRASDRALLAAAGRLLPPARRHGLLVTPQTLLRWQRELVRRRWTYPHRPNSCDATDSAASCANTTSPQHDGTRFGTLQGRVFWLLPGADTPWLRLEPPVRG